MPNNIKGFTNRFLKIVINCNGLEFNHQDNKQSLKIYFSFHSNFCFDFLYANIAI